MSLGLKHKNKKMKMDVMNNDIESLQHEITESENWQAFEF